MSTRGELERRAGELLGELSTVYLELARLEVAPVAASAPRPTRRRAPVRPVQVCDAGPVDELAARRAKTALSRYPR